MIEEFLWVEKYRPKTVADTILPIELKKTFQQFVDQKNVPNLILSGSAGVGKTTIAKAMLDELGCDYLVINGSLDRNIDTLRVTIQQFASSVSFLGGRKYVILDEADYLNANSTQPALRNFMEEFSSNCGFILTCNYKTKIIAPLHSRCSVVEFNIDKKEAVSLKTQFYKRVVHILKTENISYEKEVVAEFINKYYPDWRRIINELQRYSATGKIDSGILTNFHEVSIKELMGYLKEKDWSSARKWAAENSQTDPNQIFRKLYDSASNYMDQPSVARLTMIIAESQYRAAFVVDQEINMADCLAKIMVDCDFR